MGYDALNQYGTVFFIGMSPWKSFGLQHFRFS
jgi:hypothetical protein